MDIVHGRRPLRLAAWYGGEGVRSARSTHGSPVGTGHLLFPAAAPVVGPSLGRRIVERRRLRRSLRCIQCEGRHRNGGECDLLEHRLTPCVVVAHAPISDGNREMLWVCSAQYCALHLTWGSRHRVLLP